MTQCLQCDILKLLENLHRILLAAQAQKFLIVVRIKRFNFRLCIGLLHFASVTRCNGVITELGRCWDRLQLRTEKWKVR